MNRSAGFAETFASLRHRLRHRPRQRPYVCIVSGKIYDWGESEEEARRNANETAATEGDRPRGKMSFKPASVLAVALLQEFWPDVPGEISIETEGYEVYVTDES